MKITPQTLGLGFSEAILLSSADRRSMLAKAKGLGTTTVRCEVPWQLVEKTKGAYDWSTTDALFSDIAAAGLDVLVVVAHGPGQALGHPGINYPGWLWVPGAAGTPQDLCAFVVGLVLRYPAIRAIEIFNEQNTNVNWPSADPKTYTPWLIAAHDAIKKVDPAITVLLGGLAACVTYHRGSFFWIPAVDTYHPLDYLKAVHAAGGKDAYDVVSYHPYPLADDYSTSQAPSPTQKFVGLTAQLRAFSGKPIWCTEFGFSLNAWTATQQAFNLGAEIDMLAGMDGVERLYAYCLRDNNGEEYGMYDASSVARPQSLTFKGKFS